MSRAHRASTSPPGLSSAEAARLLETYGPNSLPITPGPGIARRIVAQFVHFFAILLWVAAGLALVAGLPELTVAIVGVIVLNGIFAFVQEHRAEKAGERLRDIVPRRAIAIRDGQPRDIDATELVPGDLVMLNGGDRVCADVRTVDGHGLRVDESILTGESLPVEKDDGDLLNSGTFIVEGMGTGLVEATGSSTRLASVAALTTQVERPLTPLAREIRRLVRTTALIAVVVGVIFILTGLALDMNPASGLILGVGVMVALVPEALLPTVTLSLAIGAQRMARQHALVRRLEAVETLGSTTFLCTDKTGTLTQNRMAVVEVWTSHGTARISGNGYEPDADVSTSSPDTVPAIREIAIAARRCSTGTATLVDGRWEAVGDPMEAALDVFARRLGLVMDREERRDPVLRRYPFDPRRRRMSVTTSKGMYLKGAPDAVFPVCTNATQDAFRAVEDLTSRGLRVLAVARGADGEPRAAGDATFMERDLDLLGLIGLADPPRANAGASVRACRAAGLKLALVTGDHPSTAKAIADEVGLYLPGAPVLAGAELSPDDAVLAAQVDHDGAVFSRVTPEDKLRIAKALRSRGHVVAMTGDGVNDGPALREADIGVAMGMSGTDVAREAADLVLLDDDLATVITAIGLGRATFANARRFLTYHLTDNVAELVPFVVWALSGGVIPLALGVLQIIALDLGTDTLSATALGAEPAHWSDGKSKPSSGRLLDRAVAKRAFGVLGPTEALFEMAAFFAVFVASGWRPGEPFPTHMVAAASGAAFATVVLAQTANAFACRSASRPVWRIRVSSNWLLVWAAAIELVIAAVFLFITPIADVLGHTNPPGPGWLIAFASIPVLLAVDAIHKRLVGRARGADV